jgi:hypothetical protein
MEAVSVGHDLTRGVTEFRRPARVAPTYEVVSDTAPGDDLMDPDEEDRDAIDDAAYAVGATG